MLLKLFIIIGLLLKLKASGSAYVSCSRHKRVCSYWLKYFDSILIIAKMRHDLANSKCKQWMATQFF